MRQNGGQISQKKAEQHWVESKLAFGQQSRHNHCGQRKQGDEDDAHVEMLAVRRIAHESGTADTHQIESHHRHNQAGYFRREELLQAFHESGEHGFKCA